MWFFFLVWFAFLCGCLKIMCSRAIHICAYECIQAFVSVCLWKNWLNYVNNKITTVGHHFIGFRWQTDHQSLRCFSPCLAGKATDGLKWCCSVCSEHTVVVNVAIRNSPQKTEWSTLSNMMQHSSVSTLWIWVMFFPHTLQRMHNSSGLFCAVLCVFLCSAFSNKLHILKTIAHCTNSSLLNSFVPWHTISPCRQSQTSCTVQRFSCPASTKKDLFEGCNRYPNK